MATVFDDDGPAGHGFDAAALERLRVWLLDEIGIGLIVCDGGGSVRYANRCAEEELAAGSALRRVGTALRCAGASTPPLAPAIAAARHKGHCHLVEVVAGAQRLMLAVAPLPQPAPADPLVLVVLGRRSLCSTLGLELLSTGHGLTLAERRVLADLLDESTPREIAAAHGVAVSTVRSQVASIRTKLGVHSVEALLHLVAEVPPVPGARPAGAARPMVPDPGGPGPH
jgi:DNA-binding CsgD family transcriptional regulator